MRILWRVLVALVLVAAIVGIGVYAYNIGMAQGLAQKLPVPAGGPVQMPYLYYGHPFFGFGFGLLGCLVPLFLFFLVFGSLRALFWHGPMGWRTCTAGTGAGVTRTARMSRRSLPNGTAGRTVNRKTNRPRNNP